METRRTVVVLGSLLALVACAGGGEEAPGGATDAAVAPGGAPSTEPAETRGFRCQGNEPFWVLLIEGGEARLTTLAEPGVERRFRGGFERKGNTGSAGLRWRGTEEGHDASGLEALIVEERCLDTMSDETPPFSHSVRVTFPDGTEANGCCREPGFRTGPS